MGLDHGVSGSGRAPASGDNDRCRSRNVAGPTSSPTDTSAPRDNESWYSLRSVCSGPYRRREWRDLRGRRQVAGGRHSCMCFRRPRKRGVRRLVVAGAAGGTCGRTSRSAGSGSGPAGSSGLGRTGPVRTNFGSGRYRQPLVRGFLSCKRVSSVCTNFCSFCRPSRRLDHHLLVPCTRGCTRTSVFLYAPRTSFPPHTLLPCSFLCKDDTAHLHQAPSKKRDFRYRDLRPSTRSLLQRSTRNNLPLSLLVTIIPCNARC